MSAIRRSRVSPEFVPDKGVEKSGLVGGINLRLQGTPHAIHKPAQFLRLLEVYIKHEALGLSVM